MSSYRKKQQQWFNQKVIEDEVTFNQDESPKETLGGAINKPVTKSLETLLNKPQFVQPKRFKIKKNNIKLIL